MSAADDKDATFPLFVQLEAVDQEGFKVRIDVTMIPNADPAHVKTRAAFKEMRDSLADKLALFAYREIRDFNPHLRDVKVTTKFKKR